MNLSTAPVLSLLLLQYLPCFRLFYTFPFLQNRECNISCPHRGNVSISQSGKALQFHSSCMAADWTINRPRCTNCSNKSNHKFRRGRSSAIKWMVPLYYCMVLLLNFSEAEQKRLDKYQKCVSRYPNNTALNTFDETVCGVGRKNKFPIKNNLKYLRSDV